MDTLPISLTPTVHREFVQHLDRFVRESEQILAAWDAYSEDHTDLDGWPYDEDAYGLRKSRRDADTAEAFEAVRAGARHLLATAETQLTALPAGTVQNRWVWQIGTLHNALERLESLHAEWLQTRDNLPANARPGTDVYEDALADYHAESWSYLGDWATHGRAILDIHAAALKSPPRLLSAVRVPGTAAARRRVGRPG
ncbi:hypothetical protein ACF09C_26820 [Streptomyces sp. NPDC014870]|uniref:hypothetical protein n=1 Tax=Streptomyces sp. NPDC014870 TaxID=3364925 RepID=UPI0036FC5367